MNIVNFLYVPLRVEEPGSLSTGIIHDAIYTCTHGALLAARSSEGIRHPSPAARAIRNNPAPTATAPVARTT